jgi:tetratricopeptide (TPR) repeat protein
MDSNQLTASSTSLKRPKLNGPAQEGFEPSVICAPAPHVPVADSELGVVPAAIRQPSGQLPMELLYPPGTPKTNRNAQHADDEARAALSQAAAAYANGDYLHVVTLCRQYCATQPARADVLLLLGAAYYQLRDYRACMDANDAAILLNPLLPEAHCNLANALQQMGNIDLAIMYV